MRVLVLGSGAKDHAIAWWFYKSNYLEALFCAPGDFATAEISTNLPNVNPANKEEVLDACIKNKIDFVFTGTEEPLQNGVIDHLNENGVKTFGAPSRALILEGDRNFAKEFTDRYNIPSPKRNLFTDIESLEKFLSRHKGEGYVIKSNTITPSRIMLDSSDTDALIKYAKNLFEIGPVLLEEHIDGLAVTATVLLDNNGYLTLPITADYTHSTETDTTPTGGMGSICPVSLSTAVRQAIVEQVLEPTLYGMKVEGLSYKGVLTFSLIVKDNSQPVLVDYHIRFNDPATQAMVPIINTDLIAILEAMNMDRINEITLETNKNSTVAVVVASEGYPLDPVKNVPIQRIPSYLLFNSIDTLPLIFTGAVREKDGVLYTDGGRCFTIVGRGRNIEEANANAYKVIDSFNFKGAWYREDIGNKFFEKNSKR